MSWLDRLGASQGGPPHERLLAVTESGAVVHSLDGDGTVVVITPEFDRDLLRDGAALVLVHNHPTGTSLSSNDISHLAKGGVAASSRSATTAASTPRREVLDFDALLVRGRNATGMCGRKSVRRCVFEGPSRMA